MLYQQLQLETSAANIPQLTAKLICPVMIFYINIFSDYNFTMSKLGRRLTFLQHLSPLSVPSQPPHTLKV